MTAMKENGLLYPSQPHDQRSEVKGQGRSVVLGLVMDPMLGIINGAMMAHYNWLLICSFSFCCEATSDSIPSGSLRLEGKLSYLYAPAWKFLGHLLLFRFFFSPFIIGQVSSKWILNFLSISFPCFPVTFHQRHGVKSPPTWIGTMIFSIFPRDIFSWHFLTG